MKIILKVDPDRHTVRQLLALERARGTAGMIGALAPFCHTEAGEPMQTAQVEAALEVLTINELKAWVASLGASVQEAQREAVPPQTSAP